MRFSISLFSLATTVCLTVSSHAATSVPFTITLTSVPGGASALTIGQQFHGSISYSAVILESGREDLTPAKDSSITLTFDFEGSTYTRSDDEGYPGGGYPILSFQDGKIHWVSFYAGNKSSGSSLDGFVSLESSNTFVYSYDGVREFIGTVTWGPAVSVPEPSALLLAAAAPLAGLRRRRAS